MSTMIKFLLGVCCAVAAEAVMAKESYQFSIPAIYLNSSADDGAESTAWQTGVIGYLSPVIYGDYPHAEADFIARKPFLGIFAGRVKVDILSSSFRGNIYAAAAGYGDAEVPIALTVDYLSLNSTGQVNAANVETRFASKAANLAYFVTDRAAINVGYDKISRRSTTEGYENKRNCSAISVQYKGIFSIPNMQYLNFETGIRRVKNDSSPNGRELSLMLDYYVNRSLGIGVGFENTSGGEESDQGRRISLRASQFVVDSLRLGVSFDKFLAKNAEDNFRDLSIMLDYRF